jgi:heterodisulfide reductase subunit C
MAAKLSFSQEIANLLHATHGNPVQTCIQCGTCSGTCPAVDFMDHSPRELIGMIRADLKDEVLASNTFWTCASCYHCTVRCPAGINITDLMYGLKRYTIWKDQYQEGLVGPVFSEAFVKTIVRSGRSYEPILAPAYIFSFSLGKFLQEVQTATTLMLKGRVPVLPPRIKRLESFRRMVGRIIPVGGDL